MRHLTNMVAEIGLTGMVAPDAQEVRFSPKGYRIQEMAAAVPMVALTLC